MVEAAIIAIAACAGTLKQSAFKQRSTGAFGWSNAFFIYFFSLNCTVSCLLEYFHDIRVPTPDNLMADLDVNFLRPLLDEHEKYACSIMPDDPRFKLAHEMLGIINMARESLRPSADSTANYVQNKEIIEKLVTLREKAENMPKGKT